MSLYCVICMVNHHLARRTSLGDILQDQHITVVNYRIMKSYDILLILDFLYFTHPLAQSVYDRHVMSDTKDITSKINRNTLNFK